MKKTPHGFEETSLYADDTFAVSGGCVDPRNLQAFSDEDHSDERLPMSPFISHWCDQQESAQLSQSHCQDPPEGDGGVQYQRGYSPPQSDQEDDYQSYVASDFFGDDLE
jgi:hypothetical protein